MYIKRLRLFDYRNYTDETAEFSPGVNIITGQNAQGKTNLLEAVYLCSIGKCARVARDRELIRWGQTRAKVSAEAVKDYGSDSVDVVIDKSIGKCVSVNGLPLTRLGELMGVVTSVLFSPAEIGIVKEAPDMRRKFIDIALCQLSKAYFYLLTRYNKILSQRNKLLKSGRADEDSLYVWDLQLADCGAKVIKTRKGFISRLGPLAAEAHGELTGGREEFALCYEGLNGESAEEIKERFFAELKRTRESDIRLGFTHAGPQRDDLKISVGGADARSYGSQGQIRSAALSLKLAELELIKNETGECPVLLLDDVLSELDLNRQRMLLKKIARYQTVITCTHVSEELKLSAGDYKAMTVNAGRIEDNR